MNAGYKSTFYLHSSSKFLFNIILKGSKKSERRLMLTIATEREAFRKAEISDKKLIWSGDNVTDGLTKRMFQAVLKATRDGNILFGPVHWIIKPETKHGVKNSIFSTNTDCLNISARNTTPSSCLTKKMSLLCLESLEIFL